MIHPAVLPDEIVVSLFARACRINGVSDYADFASQFFGETCPSFIGARLDFPEISRKTLFRYGGPMAFVENLTVLGARSRLGEIDADVLSAIAQGHYRPSLSELVFSGPAALKYCSECLHADLMTYGMTYWHRMHQVQVLPICPKHRKALISYEMKKGGLQTQFPLPGDIQSDSPRHYDGGDEIGGFLGELVDVVRGSFRSEPLMETRVVKATILDGLRSRRLVNCRGSFRKKEMVEQIAVVLTETACLAALADPKVVAKRLVAGLESHQGLPFGNALWIAWLFGSWDAFIERCGWVGILGVDVCLSDGRTTQTVESDLIDHHRQVCTDYVRLNPGCTRLEFTRAEYRSFRWLRHNDSAWLQERLPVLREGGGAWRLF